MKARASLKEFNGAVISYNGHANLFTLTAFEWDGRTEAIVNESFSSPTCLPPPMLPENNFTWSIELSYKRHCANDWYGFTCSSYCKSLNDSSRCYTCEPITGQYECCDGTVNNTNENCRWIATGPGIPSNVNNGTNVDVDSNRVKELYFWLFIGLAIFSLLMTILTTVAVIVAICLYRKSKKKEPFEHYQSHWRNRQTPATISPIYATMDRSSSKFSSHDYSLGSLDSFGSCPSEMRRHQSRV